jgi:hypothetical protein
MEGGVFSIDVSGSMYSNDKLPSHQDDIGYYATWRLRRYHRDVCFWSEEGFGTNTSVREDSFCSAVFVGERRYMGVWRNQSGLRRCLGEL